MRSKGPRGGTIASRRLESELERARDGSPKESETEREREVREPRYALAEVNNLLLIGVKRSWPFLCFGEEDKGICLVAHLSEGELDLEL